MLNKKLRVLMVVFNLSVANGVSSFVMNYFRSLDHDDVTVDFVVYQDMKNPYYEEIESMGGKIFYIPSIRNIRKHRLASKKVIVEGNYDIVHDNILILSYFIMYYAKKYHIPVRILHSHTSKLGETHIKEIRNKLFMPFLLGAATDYFACSELAAKKMFGNMPYTFIPNVVSVQNLSFKKSIRDTVRRKFGVENKVIIGSVGRLAVQKNPYYAIDIIVEAKKIIPNLQYWWIGAGPLDEKIKAYIKSKKAGQYIHLLGNRTDVPDLYQAMDLFFLPSVFEGLGIVAIEAEAVGLPCLVSDVVPHEIVYTDLVTFFSIKELPANVAVQMSTMKINPLRREKYAQVLLKSQFSDQKAGKFLIKCYQNALH